MKQLDFFLLNSDWSSALLPVPWFRLSHHLSMSDSTICLKCFPISGLASMVGESLDRDIGAVANCPSAERSGCLN